MAQQRSGSSLQDSSARVPTNVQEPIEDLVDSISILSKQVKDGTVSSNSCSYKDKESYWKAFDESIQGISSWALRTTILFSKPPCPDRPDVLPLLAGLERAVLSLASLFGGLAVELGSTLHSEVKTAVVSLLKSSQDHLQCIRTHGCSPGVEEKVGRTARLNELCSQTLKSLSRDNMAAVFRVLLSQFQLLQDASTEMEEVANDNGRQDMVDLGDDDEEGEEDGGCDWSADDRVFLAPCIELVKLVPEVVKGLSRSVVQNGRLCPGECIREMDQVAGDVQALSSLMDDVVTAAYAPLDRRQTKESVDALSAAVSSLLHHWKSSHFKPAEPKRAGKEEEGEGKGSPCSVVTRLQHILTELP